MASGIPPKSSAMTTGSTFDNVKLHGSKYLELIARRGRFVSWEEAVICSCVNPQHGSQPSYGCKVCRGVGYWYRAPIESRVLLTSMTEHADFQQMAGMFETGDAVMTVPEKMYALPEDSATRWDITKQVPVPAYEVGMYDIITVLDDDFKSSEVLVRGESLFARDADTLLNPKVVRILQVSTGDAATGEVTTFTEGDDFTLEDGNRLAWIDGKGPAFGTSYSVTYRHQPTFIVVANLPKPRYQDGQLLPRYVALRYRAAGIAPVNTP